MLRPKIGQFSLHVVIWRQLVIYTISINIKFSCFRFNFHFVLKAKAQAHRFWNQLTNTYIHTMWCHSTYLKFISVSSYSLGTFDWYHAEADKKWKKKIITVTRTLVLRSLKATIFNASDLLSRQTIENNFRYSIVYGTVCACTFAGKW